MKITKVLKKCLKMFSENYRNDGIERYAGALYEEGKKVYAFLPKHDTADLLYDFDCDVDDEIRTSEGRMLVTDIVQEVYGGIVMRFYHLFWFSDDGKHYLEVCKWIEGIGGCIDFFDTLPGYGKPTYLVCCEVNGEIFYPTGGGDNITIPTNKSVNSNFHDLSGRHLPSRPTQKGIYIKDGRF